VRREDRLRCDLDLTSFGLLVEVVERRDVVDQLDLRLGVWIEGSVLGINIEPCLLLEKWL